MAETRINIVYDDQLEREIQIKSTHIRGKGRKRLIRDKNGRWVPMPKNRKKNRGRFR